MKKNLLNIGLLLFTMGLSGCSSNYNTTKNIRQKPSKSAQIILNKSENSEFKKQFNDWKGTPYKYGGIDKYGVDCSAFVQSVIVAAKGNFLPRATKKQSQVGYKIDISEAKSGDLVFFKTTQKNNHVGIFLGEHQFMHASTSKGVIISRLDNPYWASVFWQVRRIN